LRGDLELLSAPVAQPSSLALARFRRLARRSRDIWQGGIVRVPLWVDGPDGTPYRPWGGVWASLETGLVNVKLGESNTGDATLAVDALIELGVKFAQTRPAAIQVTDPALGEDIARALDDPELQVLVVPRLDAVKPLLERMAAEASGEPPPSALSARGVTVESMRAFAAAARDFYAARPWRHLSDEDLIRVEMPSVAKALRYVTVLRERGAHVRARILPLRARLRQTPSTLPDSYAFGSREEAMICVDELGKAWTATPGAVQWLAMHAPAGKRGKRRR
jgi:hypothetical protein